MAKKKSSSKVNLSRRVKKCTHTDCPHKGGLDPDFATEFSVNGLKGAYCNKIFTTVRPVYEKDRFGNALPVEGETIEHKLMCMEVIAYTKG